MPPTNSHSHIIPRKALPLMVNDSSFSFEFTHKLYDAGFCLSVAVVILVWEAGLVVKCVGVHVSCHIWALVWRDSEFHLRNLFWVWLSYRTGHKNMWNIDFFFFSLSTFLRSLRLVCGSATVRVTWLHSSTLYQRFFAHFDLLIPLIHTLNLYRGLYKPYHKDLHI